MENKQKYKIYLKVPTRREKKLTTYLKWNMAASQITPIPPTYRTLFTHTHARSRTLTHTCLSNSFRRYIDSSIKTITGGEWKPKNIKVLNNNNNNNNNARHSGKIILYDPTVLKLYKNKHLVRNKSNNDKTKNNQYPVCESIRNSSTNICIVY